METGNDIYKFSRNVCCNICGCFRITHFYKKIIRIPNFSNEFVFICLIIKDSVDVKNFVIVLSNIFLSVLL